MTDFDEEQMSKLAHAALLIDNEEIPASKRPDLDELWDWNAGFVAGPRASEIRAHVARDPEMYELWRQMRTCIEEAETVYQSADVALGQPEAVQTSRAVEGKNSHEAPLRNWREVLGDWFSPGALTGGFATAAVLITAIGVGIKSSPPRADIWEGWTTIKSVSAVVFEPEELPEMQAYLSGMHQQMWDMSLVPVGPDGRRLPRTVPECATDDTVCTERRASLHELGRLSVEARFECVFRTSPNENRLDKANALLVQLELEKYAARLLAPLRSWVNAGEDTGERCAAISTLMARVLAAQDSFETGRTKR